jgi:hypothetical protein
MENIIRIRVWVWGHNFIPRVRGMNASRRAGLAVRGAVIWRAGA